MCNEEDAAALKATEEHTHKALSTSTGSSSVGSEGARVAASGHTSHAKQEKVQMFANKAATIAGTGARGADGDAKGGLGDAKGGKLPKQWANLFGKGKLFRGKRRKHAPLDEETSSMQEMQAHLSERYSLFHKLYIHL